MSDKKPCYNGHMEDIKVSVKNDPMTRNTFVTAEIQFEAFLAGEAPGLIIGQRRSHEQASV